MPRDSAAQKRLHAKRERHRLQRIRATESVSLIASAHTDVLGYYAGGTNIQFRSAKKQPEIVFPTAFSFIDNPQPTLDALSQLVGHTLNPGVSRVIVNQRDCATVGLAAEAVASVLAKHASEKHGQSLSGYVPRDPTQTDIVVSVGMPHVLGLSDARPNFMVFDLFHGKKRADPSPHTANADVGTTALVQYIDRCLKQFGHALTSRGREHFAKLVGEVIDNAEQHSNRSDWWIAAYLRYQREARRGDCRMTIFCFGQSLADSLRSLPGDSKLRRHIVNCINQCSRRRRFHRQKRFYRDDLWTVHALQGRVSCQNTSSDTIGDRGQGTADMIETFQYLSADSGTMCLLSGHTQILFDGTYKMKRSSSGSRRVLAFNPANDLTYPPDTQHVRHLTRRFPGTLLSLRFSLEEEHLRRVSRSTTHN